MLAFDIQGFSRPDQRTRVTLRTALRDLLSQSLSSAGINWTQLEMADFGDGALVLLDPQVSKTRPLYPLLSQLARSLARHNSTLPSTARLRLRLAVHSGEVQRTRHGFVGEDLDVAFRLLSARTLRSRLARSSADLVLIISDRVYERAIVHPRTRDGHYEFPTRPGQRRTRHRQGMGLSSDGRRRQLASSQCWIWI